MTPFTAITLNYAVAITVNTQNEATLDPVTVAMNLRSAIKANQNSLTGEDDHAVVDHFRIDYCGREPLANRTSWTPPGRNPTPAQIAALNVSQSPVSDAMVDNLIERTLREKPPTVDTAPDHELTADQLDEKYNPDGDGEHPRFTRIDWQLDIAAGDTLSGYWSWLRHQLITEYENLPENQVNVYDFSVKVTAPVELSREEVHDLLMLFSSAATVELEGCASNDDEEEADKARATLKLNIEILP